MITGKAIYGISKWVILMGFLLSGVVGCMSNWTIGNEIPPAIPLTNTPTTTQAGLIVTRQMTREILSSPSWQATIVPTVTPIPSRAITPSPTPTTSPIPLSLTGSLLISNDEGISLISLETEQKVDLFQPSSDVQYWDTFASPNGAQLLYWQQTTVTSELWVMTLESGLLEKLATLPDTNYEGIGLEWLGSNRYLAVSLWRTNEISIFTRVISLLIDIEEKEVKATLLSWKEMCVYLAFSPRTNRMATWCSIEDEPLSYLVAETTGGFWSTDDSPTRIVRDRSDLEQGWYWSRNNDYVVYTIFQPTAQYPDPLQILYFSPTSSYTPIPLWDGRTSIYSTLSLSPDGQYVAYGGTCPDGGGCHLIMYIPTQEIIWTSQMLSEGSSELLLAWSPDSHYVATSVLGETGIFIIDITTQQVALEIEDAGYEVLAWIDK